MGVAEVLERATKFSTDISDVTQQMQSLLERSIDKRDFQTFHLVRDFQKQLHDAQSAFLEEVLELAKAELEEATDHKDRAEGLGALFG